MYIEYKREMNHSYLVLGTGEIPQIQSYEVKMMVNNTPKGLLACSVRYMNGEPLFYYEVTSKQNVKALFERKKFTGKDLKKIFHALADAMDEMEGYLLDIDTLLLYPEYIYMDIEEQEVHFCCFPVAKETEGSFLVLTEYILPRIDHEDQEAVLLGYGIYRESLESSITSKQIRKELNRMPVQKRKRELPEQEKQEEIPIDPAEEERMAAMDSFFEDEEEEKRSYLSLTGIIFTLSGVSACIYLLLHYEFLEPVWFLAGLFLLLAVGLGVGAFFLYKKRKAPGENEKLAEIKMPGITHIPVFSGFLKEEESECGPTVLLTEAENRKKPPSLTWKEHGNSRKYTLEKETVLIGKLKSVTDICLEDPSVSRIHIRIQKDGEEYYMTDLNSRNGTYLNGDLAEPEHRYSLRDGDKIKTGNTEFCFSGRIL